MNADTNRRVGRCMDTIRILMRHGGAYPRTSLRAEVGTSGAGLNSDLDALIASGFVEQVPGAPLRDPYYAITADGRVAWAHAPGRIRSTLATYFHTHT